MSMTRALILALLAGAAWGQTVGGLTAVPTILYEPESLTNPGFEIVSPLSWSGSANITRVTDVFHSGAASLHWTFTAADSFYQDVTVTAGTYQLSVWVKTNISSGTGFRISAYMPVAYPWSQVWSSSPLATGVGDWVQLSIPKVTVPVNGTLRVKCEIPYTSVGEAWVDDVSFTRERHEITPFLKYPNYRGILWSDYSQVTTWGIDIEPPDGTLSDYRAHYVVTDENTSTVVGSGDVAIAATPITPTIDFTSFTAAHSFTVDWTLVLIADGSTVGSYASYRIVKLDSATRASFTASATPDNRMMIRGVPTFILGVYDAPSTLYTTQAAWESYLTLERKLFDLPINFYNNYTLGLADNTSFIPFMNDLATHGIMTLQTANAGPTWPPDSTFWWLNASTADKTTRAAHSQFLGVYVGDEPGNSYRDTVLAQSIDNRSIDPDGINFGMLIGTYATDVALWRDACDWMFVDPYTMNGVEPVGGYDLSLVQHWMDNVNTASQQSRPVGAMIQFFESTFLGQSRWPTQSELRNQAYMAIAEGADGIMFWTAGTSGAGSNALHDYIYEYGRVTSVTKGSPTVLNVSWHPNCTTTCTVTIRGATGDWSALNGNWTASTTSSSAPMTITGSPDSTAYTGTFDGVLDIGTLSYTNREMMSVTNGNPTVFTVPGHGLVAGTGDTVYMYEGTGSWAAFGGTPGKDWTATVIDADHFSIPVDSTGFSGSWTGQIRNVWEPRILEQWNKLVPVVTELASLQGPLSVIDNTTKLISVSDSNIHTRVKAYGGKHYLVASNVTSGTIAPTFTWAANVASVTADKGTGGEAAITPSGATFSDEFTGYAAHVYELQEGAAIPMMRVRHGSGVRFGAGVKR